MASIKEITGGTGDVNPQILHVILSQATADANTLVEIPVPVPRYSTRKNRSVIMEVFRVLFDDETVDPGVPTLDTDIICTVSTSAGAKPSSPRTFAVYHFQNQVSASVVSTTQAIQGVVWPFTIEFNDNAGHGLLIATDNLTFRLDSTNTAKLRIFHVRLFYRLKEVDLQEYIGIVQSQS